MASIGEKDKNVNRELEISFISQMKESLPLGIKQENRSMDKKETILLELEKTALVITRCIFPEQRVAQLVIKESDIRYQQYVESILSFVEKSKFKKIIFCDNSGYSKDLSLIDYIKNLVKNLNGSPLKKAI